jgi:hypothetical protein
MAGTGYNIPISVSASETLSIPTSYNAPNNIVFGNAYLLGDSSAQSNPVQPSTANSAAAEGGNASTQSSGSGVSGSGSNANGGGTSWVTWVSLGVGVLSLVAVIYIAKHKG